MRRFCAAIITGFLLVLPSVALSWDAGSWSGVRRLTGTTTLSMPGLGTTSTDGLVLENTTAAAAGAQQISSRVRWSGRGWETDTGSSQQTDYIAQLVPVQGAAAPQARLDFNYAINGGALQATPTMSLLDKLVGIGIIIPLTPLHVVQTLNNSAATIENTNLAFNGITFSIKTSKAADSSFEFLRASAAGAAKFRVRSDGSVDIGGGGWGANATKVLSFSGPATPPTTRPPDAFTVYPLDVNGAGTMGLAWMSEDNGVGILGLNNGFGTTAPIAKVNLPPGTTYDKGILLGYATQGFSLWYDENVATTGYIDSRYDSASSVMQFRMRVSGTPVNAMTIVGSGNVALGTVTFPTATTRLAIFDSTQLAARIGLTGQEFWEAANTSTDGLAFVLGVNRASNRQLWIGDTAALAKNTTNTVLRFVVGGTGMPTIDAISTDSTTTKVFALGNASGIQYGKALVALGGGAAPTLGTIGGSGPTVAAQNAWIQMQDSTGANVWIAVWK